MEGRDFMILINEIAMISGKTKEAVMEAVKAYAYENHGINDMEAALHFKGQALKGLF